MKDSAMRNLKFDCPVCGEKKSAYISQTYRTDVVHKCHGKNLMLVGNYDYEKNHIVTITNSTINQGESGKVWRTRSCVISQLESIEKVMQLGRVLNNNAQGQHAAEKYLASGKIFKVESGLEKEIYMIHVENGTIKASHFFSGKHVSRAPIAIVREVVFELQRVGIITHQDLTLWN